MSKYTKILLLLCIMSVSHSCPPTNLYMKKDVIPFRPSTYNCSMTENKPTVSYQKDALIHKVFVNTSIITNILLVLFCSMIIF